MNHFNEKEMQLLKADINVALGDTILSVNMYIYKTEQNRI